MKSFCRQILVAMAFLTSASALASTQHFHWRGRHHGPFPGSHGGSNYCLWIKDVNQCIQNSACFWDADDNRCEARGAQDLCNIAVTPQACFLARYVCFWDASDQRCESRFP